MEYPNNNVNSLTNKRGYGTLFSGIPAGNATYCSMSYSNRGGNALSDVDTTAKGSLSWSQLTGCNTVSAVIVADEKQQIEVAGNVIKLSGLIANEIISVYNLLGINVISKSAKNDTESLLLEHEGIYIVAINETKLRKKILIRNKN